MTDDERLNNALEQRVVELAHQYADVDPDTAISQLIAIEASQEFLLMNILMAAKDTDVPRSHLVYIIFDAINGLHLDSKAIIDFMENTNLYHKERD